MADKKQTKPKRPDWLPTVQEALDMPLSDLRRKLHGHLPIEDFGRKGIVELLREVNARYGD